MATLSQSNFVRCLVVFQSLRSLPRLRDLKSLFTLFSFQNGFVLTFYVNSKAFAVYAR